MKQASLLLACVRGSDHYRDELGTSTAQLPILVESLCENLYLHGNLVT